MMHKPSNSTAPAQKMLMVITLKKFFIKTVFKNERLHFISLSEVKGGYLTSTHTLNKPVLYLLNNILLINNSIETIITTIYMKAGTV